MDGDAASRNVWVTYRAMTLWLRGVAAIGLLAAVTTFVTIAFVAPDAGVDISSLMQGLTVGSVIAAVPVATIVRPITASRAVALGGAMTVAGVATNIGGNLFGLLMALSGPPILFVGAYAEPPLSIGIVVRLISHAILLASAMWLSLGSAPSLSQMAAVLLSGVIATSSFWDKRDTGAPKQHKVGEDVDGVISG